MDNVAKDVPGMLQHGKQGFRQNNFSLCEVAVHSHSKANISLRLTFLKHLKLYIPSRLTTDNETFCTFRVSEHIMIKKKIIFNNC